MCVSIHTLSQMSVWKSNFFLQAGLPESLPKPPERDVVADSEFADENGLTTRRVGQRGKDKLPRKTRGPTLFNFFESMRTFESREEDGNVILTPEVIQIEYRALSKQQRAFWEFMHELFLMFKIQEKVAEWGYLGTKKRQQRKQQLLHKFYFMDESQQQQLVRDYVAHRWEKENYQYVQETCHQDNLRHLVDIRRDLKLLLAKVEKALAPPDADAGSSDSSWRHMLQPRKESTESV
jgi:hypothetical protein